MRHPKWSPEHPEYGALPWTLHTRQAPPAEIEDANGDFIITIGDVEHRVEKLERMIMAAPELLAALKACVPFVPNNSMIRFGPIFEARRAYDAATALIARIEGGK